MRFAALLLSVVALFVAGLSLGRTNITMGDVDARLDELFELGLTDPPEEWNGAPVYRARVSLCIWNEQHEEQMQCRTVTSPKEFESAEQCNWDTWQELRALSPPTNPLIHVAARVNCVPEYEA